VGGTSGSRSRSRLAIGISTDGLASPIDGSGEFLSPASFFSCCWRRRCWLLLFGGCACALLCRAGLANLLSWPMGLLW
jgi:hypothetical protein